MSVNIGTEGKLKYSVKEKFYPIISSTLSELVFHLDFWKK